jgi:hypothetical protein
MHCFQNASAYFAMGMSYICKVFVKLTPGINVIKLLFFTTNDEAKTSLSICPWKPSQTSIIFAGKASRIHKKLGTLLR